jgi:hypothetical protein
MPANRVFLSHSSIDRPFVDRLAFDLERVNVGVWYDKWEIRVGDSLIEKISQGIESSDYLAIVLSPDSVKSEWVKREVNAALIRELEEKEVVILPILITDCEIPILLREKKYADFRKSYEDGFEELLFAVSPESPVTTEDLSLSTRITSVSGHRGEAFAVLVSARVWIRQFSDTEIHGCYNTRMGPRCEHDFGATCNVDFRRSKRCPI